jgi:peptidoglycan-associated lipoprotein
MNRARRLFSTIALTAAIAVAAAGCHKKVPAPAPAPPPPPAAPATPPPPPPAPAPRPAPAPAPLSDEDVFRQKSLADLNAEKPLDDVFFDLDKSDIRDDGRTALQKDADWLKRWGAVAAGLQVTVEGHCDPRGSAEYNLALGSRRAEAVKSYLVTLGVPASRLTVVSKGKEQPFCNDENEACWQQDRRGHFIITAK